MTPVDLKAYIQFLTGTDSTLFPDTEMLLLANIHLERMTIRIGSNTGTDRFIVPAVANLVADQREYSLPAEKLNSIKYVEAMLNGSSWIRLEELDLSDLTIGTDETSITDNFSNSKGNAFYDLTRNAITIYSGTITSVTSGLKIWSQKGVPAITDLTSAVDLSVDPSATDVGFPTVFHKLLAEQVVIDWKTGQREPIPLTEGEMTWEQSMGQALADHQSDSFGSDVIASVPVEDGFNY